MVKIIYSVPKRASCGVNGFFLNVVLSFIHSTVFYMESRIMKEGAHHVLQALCSTRELHSSASTVC